MKHILGHKNVLNANNFWMLMAGWAGTKCRGEGCSSPSGPTKLAPMLITLLKLNIRKKL